MYGLNYKFNYGRITKKGMKRYLELSWCKYTIMYNRYLRSFYEELNAKRGNLKAIVANIQKTLDIIYGIIKIDWKCKVFNNFLFV